MLQHFQCCFDVWACTRSMYTSAAITQVLPTLVKYFSHLSTSIAKRNISQSIIVLLAFKQTRMRLPSLSHIYLKSFFCTWKAFWNKHPQCSNCPGGIKLKSRLNTEWKARRWIRWLYFFSPFVLWSHKLLRREVPGASTCPVHIVSIGNKQTRVCLGQILNKPKST